MVISVFGSDISDTALARTSKCVPLKAEEIRYDDEVYMAKSTGGL